MGTNTSQQTLHRPNNLWLTPLKICANRTSSSINTYAPLQLLFQMRTYAAAAAIQSSQQRLASKVPDQCAVAAEQMITTAATDLSFRSSNLLLSHNKLQLLCTENRENNQSAFRLPSG
jgi:hypothetical protein